MSVSARVLLVKFDKPPGGTLHLSYSEPIGLCYLAAYLKEKGIPCRIAHLFSEPGYSALREIITEFNPGIIGFSVRNFNYPMTVRYIARVQQEFPGTRIVMGGECITLQNAVDLGRETEVDALFINDSECSFMEYAMGTNPATIPGIVWRNQDGEYTLSTALPVCLDIASLPMMIRDDLPMEDYESEGFPGLRYATMHVQRGCRYFCTFCHTATRYRGPSSRTVDQIMAEIDFLLERYSIQAIAIWDEDFFADINRVKGIIKGLHERGNPILWHTFMKLTDLLKPELVDLLPELRKAGYLRAIIGIESFDQETLKEFHKYSGNHVEQLCARLAQNDIILCPAYIIGCPHETCKEIAAGLDRLLALRDQHKIKMDLPYIALVTPFPGTELAEEYENNGLIIDRDWSHYDTEHVVVQSKCQPEKLLELRDIFYARFYGKE